MIAFLRLLKILTLVLRYRLDQLIPIEQLPTPVKAILSITRVLPNNDRSRGLNLRLFSGGSGTCIR